MRAREYQQAQSSSSLEELSNLEKNPLGPVYVIKRTWYSRATSQRYPSLFNSSSFLQEHYSKEREGYEDFYTFGYVTEPLELDILLKMDPSPDLNALLYAQRRLEIPGKTIRLVPNELNYLGVQGWTRRPDSYELKGVFEEDDNSPDLEHASSTGPEDLKLNVFLALQLIRAKGLPQPILDPQQLNEYAKRNGLNLDSKALLRGFQDLMVYHADEVVSDIPEKLNIYNTGSNWSLMLAEYILKHSRIGPGKNNSNNIEYFLPHFYPDNQEDTRDVYLLPFMATSLLSFAGDLPYILKDGQAYDPARLRENINKLYEIAIRSLTSKLEERLGKEGDLVSLFEEAKIIDPKLAEEIQLINGILRYLKPEFDTLIKAFHKMPELLNRKGSSLELGSIPNYDELRQRILDTGARISEKTLSIRLKGQVRSGNI